MSCPGEKCYVAITITNFMPSNFVTTLWDTNKCTIALASIHNLTPCTACPHCRHHDVIVNEGLKYVGMIPIILKIVLCSLEIT